MFVPGTPFQVCPIFTGKDQEPTKVKNLSVTLGKALDLTRKH